MRLRHLARLGGTRATWLLGLLSACAAALAVFAMPRLAHDNAPAAAMHDSTAAAPPEPASVAREQASAVAPAPRSADGLAKSVAAPLLTRPGPRPGVRLGVTDDWQIEDLYAAESRQYFAAVRSVTISEHWIAARWFELLDELPNLESVTVFVGGRGRRRFMVGREQPPRVHLSATLIAHLPRKRLKTLVLGGLVLDQNGIDELSKCNMLRVLAIADCELSGASLEPLSALTRLEDLCLAHTQHPPNAAGLIAKFLLLRELTLHDAGLTPEDFIALRRTFPRAIITTDADVEY
jgi:hypothetical protein